MMLCGRLCRPVLIVLALNLITQPAWAVFVWNRGRSGDPIPTANDNWSNAANWTTDEGTSTTPGGAAKGSAPLGTVNEEVIFPQVNSTNDTSLMDGGDHVLTAGLTMSRDRSAVILDLNGSRLTVDGNTFALGSWRSSPTIQNGVLQIGTLANPTVMNVYQRGDSGVETATITARLDAVNVDEFFLSNASSNINAPSQILDMSGTTISSTAGGAADNALLVNNDLIVGRYNGATSGISPNGTLMFPSSLSSIAADDIIIGENLRNSGSGVPSQAVGNVDFANSAALSLSASSSLILGHGDNATATLSNLPSSLNLTVGSIATPAVIQIGYNDRSQGTASAADNATSGGLTSLGGNVDINLTELRVGQNTQSAGSATGVLDLSAGTLVDFNADNVFVGVGVDSTGSLLLPSGSASASNVVIGSNDSGANGLIDLAGTLMFVDTALTIHGPTDDQGVLISRIQGASAGLDLSDSTTLTIGSGGLHDIRFEQESNSSGLYFGLRWEGSHVAELLSLQSSGALTITNLTSQDIGIFEQEGFTYVAVLTPVPEPASGLTLLLGVTILGWNSRRRSKGKP